MKVISKIISMVLLLVIFTSCGKDNYDAPEQLNRILQKATLYPYVLRLPNLELFPRYSYFSPYQSSHKNTVFR